MRRNSFIMAILRTTSYIPKLLCWHNNTSVAIYQQVMQKEVRLLKVKSHAISNLLFLTH